ncbi:MAG: hypothetical protein QW067_12605 [Thermofilaceae archaeon]
MSEERIVIGRNYIETLLLTLTKIEFTSPSVDVLVRIVVRLEDEVCGLSTLMEDVRNVYTRTFKKMLKEYFGKDLPLPDSLFEKCNVVQNALDYLLKNPNVAVEGRYLTSVAEEKIKTTVARIGRASIFATLYSLGLIKV